MKKTVLVNNSSKSGENLKKTKVLNLNKNEDDPTTPLSYIEKNLACNSLTFNSTKICKICYDHVVLIDYHMSCAEQLRQLMQNKIEKSFKICNTKNKSLTGFKFKSHRAKCYVEQKRRRRRFNLQSKRKVCQSFVNAENEFFNKNFSNNNKLVSFIALQLDASKDMQSSAGMKRKASLTDEMVNGGESVVTNANTINGYNKSKNLKISSKNLNGYGSPSSLESLSPSSTLSASSSKSGGGGGLVLENDNFNKNQLIFNSLLNSSILSPFLKSQIQAFKNANQSNEEHTSENEQSNLQSSTTVSPSSSNRRKNKIPSRLSNTLNCRPSLIASTNEPNSIEDETLTHTNNNNIQPLNPHISAKQAFINKHNNNLVKHNGTTIPTSSDSQLTKRPFPNKQKQNNTENSLQNKNNRILPKLDESTDKNKSSPVKSNLLSISMTPPPVAKNRLNNQNLNHHSIKKANNSNIANKNKNQVKSSSNSNLNSNQDSVVANDTSNTRFSSKLVNKSNGEFSNKENDNMTIINSVIQKGFKNKTLKVAKVDNNNENDSQLKQEQKQLANDNYDHDDLENEHFDNQRINNIADLNEQDHDGEDEEKIDADNESVVVNGNHLGIDSEDNGDVIEFISRHQQNGDDDDEDEQENNQDFERTDEKIDEEDGIYDEYVEDEENFNNDIDNEDEENDDYENTENINDNDADDDDDPNQEEDYLDANNNFQQHRLNNLNRAKQKNFKNFSTNFRANNNNNNFTGNNSQGNGILKKNLNGNGLLNKNRNLSNGKLNLKSESDAKQEYSLMSSNSLNTSINSSVNFNMSSTKHSCNICKKTFKTQNILRQHMRIHTGDKPFSCDICNKAFSQMASLKYHLATHSDDRPFKCENCAKTFKLKPPYKKHVKECQPRQKQTQQQQQPSSSSPSNNSASPFYYSNNNVNHNLSGLKIEMNDDDE